MEDGLVLVICKKLITSHIRNNRIYREDGSQYKEENRQIYNSTEVQIDRDS